MERPRIIKAEEHEAKHYCCEYDDVCNKQATHHWLKNGGRIWLCHDHTTKVRDDYFKSKA